MNPDHSILETHFPHVVIQLVQHWPDAGEYLADLLIDRRGGRRGFPPVAMSEILFLNDLLWWHGHERGASSINVEDYVFGVSRKPRLDFETVPRVAPATAPFNAPGA